MKRYTAVFITGAIAFYLFMFLGSIEQRIRIDELQSKVGNQTMQIAKDTEEIKSLNDQIDALNTKVDELPK